MYWRFNMQRTAVWPSYSGLIAWAGLRLSSCSVLSLQRQLNLIIYNFKFKWKPSTELRGRGPKGRRPVGSIVFASKRYSLQSECKRKQPTETSTSLIGTRPPPTHILSWGEDLKEQGSSLADLNQYSISKSTGPDDSFFHPSAHRHKYSNLKGGSSSSSWWRRREWRGSRLKKSRSGGESPSARTLHLAAHVTWRPMFICIVSQSKYPDHQPFYSSANSFLFKTRGSGL